ncbi:hypothetical protein E4U42_000858 [Claviceps africana]|uniref:Uncharacterized protein n=1 Tax=Claviceps africana TaxID=83212 RepID=A0A8K0NJH6_9HYPO|nr:hypothetical protein E4U42_000858 [Claviceps africana]
MLRVLLTAHKLMPFVSGSPCIIKTQALSGGRAAGSFVNELGCLHAESAASNQAPSSRGLLSRRSMSPTSNTHIQKGVVDLDILLGEYPEKLFTFHFGPHDGITDGLVRDMQRRVGLGEREAMHLEINSLGRLAQGSGSGFTSLHASFGFDDAARDGKRPSSRCVTAQEGNIGNVVNEAGLAMVTANNDAIGFHGGASANFLDAGVQETEDTMMQGHDYLREKSVLACRTLHRGRAYIPDSLNSWNPWNLGASASFKLAHRPYSRSPAPHIEPPPRQKPTVLSKNKHKSKK